MLLPTISRSFRRTKDGKDIEMVEDALPKSLQPNEVLIKVHAVSLNYRDVAMMKGLYPVKVIDQGVPCSDAAATVLAIGSAVTSFKEGDYVAPTFNLYWLNRQQKPERSCATGGDVDGLLREYAIFDQEVLTKLPAHLSHEEASTICCAGTTAWSSLDFHNKNRNPADYALMQGTGGVSVFATILCLAAGIIPVVTSSSDEKLARIKAIGTEACPVLGINYRTHPDWAEEALKLTNGKGVDVLVNNVGITSIEQSFKSLCKFGGAISLVGFLGGFGDSKDAPDCVGPVLMKSAKLQYVYFHSLITYLYVRVRKAMSTVSLTSHRV